MSDKNFVKAYLEDFATLIKPDNQIVDKIINVKNILVQAKKDNAKIMIFGNGGSAAIASHVSVDLTKNANIKAVNFNEADLITCFANDYGYENWVSNALNFYADSNDVVILISSSGQSKNIINAAEKAKKIGLSVITLSGFLESNPLREMGDINLWVNSSEYNIVESVHQVWLLSIVEYLISNKKTEI